MQSKTLKDQALELLSRMDNLHPTTHREVATWWDVSTPLLDLIMKGYVTQVSEAGQNALDEFSTYLRSIGV